MDNKRIPPPKRLASETSRYGKEERPKTRQSLHHPEQGTTSSDFNNKESDQQTKRQEHPQSQDIIKHRQQAEQIRKAYQMNTALQQGWNPYQHGSNYESYIQISPEKQVNYHPTRDEQSPTRQGTQSEILPPRWRRRRPDQSPGSGSKTKDSASKDTTSHQTSDGSNPSQLIHYQSPTRDEQSPTRQGTQSEILPPRWRRRRPDQSPGSGSKTKDSASKDTTSHQTSDGSNPSQLIHYQSPTRDEQSPTQQGTQSEILPPRWRRRRPDQSPTRDEQSPTQHHTVHSNESHHDTSQTPSKPLHTPIVTSSSSNEPGPSKRQRMQTPNSHSSSDSRRDSTEGSENQSSDSDNDSSHQPRLPKSKQHEEHPTSSNTNSAQQLISLRESTPQIPAAKRNFEAFDINKIPDNYRWGNGSLPGIYIQDKNRPEVQIRIPQTKGSLYDVKGAYKVICSLGYDIKRSTFGELTTKKNKVGNFHVYERVERNLEAFDINKVPNNYRWGDGNLPGIYIQDENRPEVQIRIPQTKSSLYDVEGAYNVICSLGYDIKHSTFGYLTIRDKSGNFHVYERVERNLEAFDINKVPDNYRWGDSNLPGIYIQDKNRPEVQIRIPQTKGSSHDTKGEYDVEGAYNVIHSLGYDNMKRSTFGNLTTRDKAGNFHVSKRVKRNLEAFDINKVPGNYRWGDGSLPGIYIQDENRPEVQIRIPQTRGSYCDTEGAYNVIHSLGYDIKRSTFGELTTKNKVGNFHVYKRVERNLEAFDINKVPDNYRWGDGNLPGIYIQDENRPEVQIRIPQTRRSSHDVEGAYNVIRSLGYNIKYQTFRHLTTKNKVGDFHIHKEIKM